MFNYYVFAPFQSYLNTNHVVRKPIKLSSRIEALEALAMGLEVHVYMPPMQSGMISFTEPASF